jgi:hypothetical protein
VLDAGHGCRGSVLHVRHFLGGRGVLTAVLGTLAVVWVTFTVGFPRRRLYYGVRAVAPLLTEPPGMRSDLELRHRGLPVDSGLAVTPTPAAGRSWLTRMC